MTQTTTSAILLAILLLLQGFAVAPRTAHIGPSSDVSAVGECMPALLDPDPPEYYRIKLVPTRRYPGTHRAIGYGDVTFVASPFGVSISGDGTYVYDLNINVERIKYPATGKFVVWLTTPDLKEVSRVGPLVDGQAHGRVDWNKFLVVVTLEEEYDEEASSWTGPVILRGMSRSGMMHTMAGHGPFESEPCAQYGYQ